MWILLGIYPALETKSITGEHRDCDGVRAINVTAVPTWMPSRFCGVLNTLGSGFLGWGKSTQLGSSLGFAMGAKLAAPDKLVGAPMMRRPSRSQQKGPYPGTPECGPKRRVGG